jgi:PAS domain S-box-containing protein
MNKSLINAKPGSRADISQALKIVYSGKPQIHLDHSAKILDCNIAFVNLISLSKKQLLSTDLTLFAQNALFIEAVRKAVSDGVSIYQGTIVFRTDFSEAYFECALFNINSKTQNEQKITCIIIDSAFPALEPLNDKISALSEKSAYLDASVSVHNTDGSALYISPSIESMLGYTCAELIELDPLYPVYPDDIQIVKNVIEKLNSGYGILNSRYRMIHKNGSVIKVESASYLIKDASGTCKHIVNVTWDISSNAKMEHALALSEQKYFRLV